MKTTHWFGSVDSKECGICHRIGVRSFVPYTAEGWRCLHETACTRRKAARDENEENQ